MHKKDIRLKLADSLIRTDIGLETILYDPRSNAAHLLTAEARLLIDSLPTTCDQKELAGLISNGDSSEEALTKVQQLIGEFFEKGILEQEGVPTSQMSRRDFGLKAATVVATASLVYSITAPQPASAASVSAPISSGTVTTANSGTPIIAPAGASSIVYTLDAVGGGGGASGGRDTTARAAGDGSRGFQGQRRIDRTFPVTPGDSVVFVIGRGGGGGVQGETGDGVGANSLGGSGGTGGSPNFANGVTGLPAASNTSGGGGGGGGRGGDTTVSLNGALQDTALGGAGGGGGEGSGVLPGGGVGPGADAFATTMGAGGNTNGGDGGNGSTAQMANTTSAAGARTGGFGGSGVAPSGDPGDMGQDGIATYTFFS